MKLKKILLVLIGSVVISLYPKIHKLDTQYSSLHELRTAYLCNYNDQEKSVICYKASLTDPESLEKKIILPAGKAYEVCGLQLGEGFVGNFEKRNSRRVSQTCSIWFMPKKE